LKSLPGRKTDVKNCQWIRDIHAHGLADECHVQDELFVPPRELVRMRLDHVRDNAREIDHMIKALRFMNINLERAVSDVTGKTGMAIIGAILDGERDPYALAGLRAPRPDAGRTGGP
jgi:hypothetical protein